MKILHLRKSLAIIGAMLTGGLFIGLVILIPDTAEATKALN